MKDAVDAACPLLQLPGWNGSRADFAPLLALWFSFNFQNGKVR
jgi:hypothetical protein